jgi:hypothetical protein
MDEELVDKVRLAIGKAATALAEGQTHINWPLLFRSRDKLARAAIAAVDAYRADQIKATCGGKALLRIVDAEARGDDLPDCP